MEAPDTSLAQASGRIGHHEFSIAVGRLSHRWWWMCTASHDVHFALDDHRLTPEGKATMDALAADLAQQPYANIRIIRHADAVGLETYNFDLARRRAKTVGAYLAQKPTVDRDMRRVLSLGEAVPLAENTTSNARAYNRRLEVRVYRLSWEWRREVALSPSTHA